MKLEKGAWRLALLGLSLTCVTATALFLLVASNPKDAEYGSTPLAYAAAAAAAAFVFNRASAWLCR